jgi:hypothetical protein
MSNFRKENSEQPGGGGNILPINLLQNTNDARI